MRSARLCTFAALILLALAISHGRGMASGPYASDPIDSFIVRCDSIANASGDQALAEFVTENRILVGAAAGRLSDIAIELDAAGQPGAAKENLDFAGRISGIYRSATGSRAPLDLVETYRGWTEAEKAIRMEAKKLEEGAVEARNAGEYERAIGAFNEAMALYESIGDNRSTAILWGSLGVTCWYQGDFEAVREHYERALEERRAIEDRILEGRTLNGLGSVNYQLGNLDLARDYYRQAIDLRRSTGDLGGLATSLTYLGNAYLAMGRMVEARNAYEEALPVVESTGNGAQQFELLMSVASLNAEMGRMTSANSTLAEALELARRLEDQRGQSLCHLNMALNLTEAFRYGEALAELDAAKRLIEEHNDPELAAVYFRNRGIANLKMGELEWARSDFDTLLEISEAHQMPGYRFEALLNLGYLLKEGNEYEKGLWYAEDAAALAEDMDSSKMLREAMVLGAELNHWLGRYDQAIRTWDALFRQDSEAGAEVNAATDLMGIANNQVVAGRPKMARQTIRKVAPIVKSTGDGDLILAVAFASGHSFEKTDPESARHYYETALEMIDESRRDIGAAELRTGYLGGLRRFYFEEVAMYYAGQALGGRVSEDQAALWSGRAFETMEKARARGLLDLIEAPLLASGTEAEDALLDSLYGLDPEEPGYAAKERQLKERYSVLRNRRLAEARVSGTVNPSVATSDEVRRILPDNTAMLAYALGDTASLLWVIDAGGCSVHRLISRDAFTDEVGRLRRAIANPVIADNELRSAARELYLAAVEPAAPFIAEHENLIVVPDGVLFELPFEVLLTHDLPGDTAWNEMPYLARTHSITYIPSASIYLAIRNESEPAGERSGFDKELLAMGAPDYTLLDPLPGYRGKIAPLPYSRDEVLGIGSSLQDDMKDVYLGGDANEAVLKQRLGSGSIRVVHLATHGIVNRNEPTASCIVLCPDTGGTEDGYFQTLEVMSQPMDVGLVVLSACESARGRIGRGEGVVGLGRAFLASGARGLVASLWAVSDQSTGRLMEEFYDNMLNEKQPAGRALNDARFALMKDEHYAHPYHWSAFVVIGLEDAPW
jgi:CHAT domain-containing protein/Tfp pilus assembly protein PilF